MKKPTALGANIFAGGFSVGVRKHFQLLGHLEHDDYGAAVSRANLGVPIYIGADSWPAKAPVRRLDWLYANPPCAIWSMGGVRKGDSENPERWKRDPRLARIRDIFSLVKRYRPLVWTWESVCQAFERGRPFVEELAGAAAALGYSASYVLVDAQYLGTPQIRKRFFLVLHRVAIDWERAKPSFEPGTTVREALRQLDFDPKSTHVPLKLPDRIKRLYHHAEEAEDFNKVFNRIVKNPKRSKRGTIIGRPSFLVKRMVYDRPAFTVIGSELLHPTRARRLAPEENAALCGFPPDYDWKLAGSDAYNQIARGVCPPVAAWLARQVAHAVKRERLLTKPRRWLVDFRQAPGAIREVTGLPVDVDLDWQPGKADRAKVKLERKPGGRQLELEFKVPRGKSSRTTFNGLGSGEYIRLLLTEGKATDSEIVALVHKNFPGRRTTQADVACQKQYLRVGRYARPELPRGGVPR